uniref:Aspartyl-tRNA synthetase n=1 Tax=Macrostomum lignano TaxID=282301 RepID=A0A1I8JN86_9PLAT
MPFDYHEGLNLIDAEITTLANDPAESRFYSGGTPMELLAVESTCKQTVAKIFFLQLALSLPFRANCTLSAKGAKLCDARSVDTFTHLAVAGFRPQRQNSTQGHRPQ